MPALTCVYNRCTEPATLDGLCNFHSPAWREAAACRGTDLAGWYSNYAEDIAERRAICIGCPVLAVCLADAQAAEHGLPPHKRYGTRAGLTPAQRAEVARNPDLLLMPTAPRSA